MKLAYVTIAARVPKEDERQLGVVMKCEGTDKSTAARKILEIGLLEWKKREALEGLRRQEMSMSAAAEFAGISIWEMMALAAEKRVSHISVSKKELEEELETLKKQ